MPAIRLNQQPVDIRRFDVIGQDSEGVLHFVGHLGLSSEQRNQVYSHDTIQFIHMGPPLQHGPLGGPVNVIGTVSLTADEIHQINIFVDELLAEYLAQNARTHKQYVIRPHVQPKRENDGTVLYLRFNCAGFVIEAYLSAGITLLRTEDEEIPSVHLETLLNAYPDRAEHLQNQRFRQREDVNLPGNGPWPVMLPGYVLNALDRQEEAVRAANPYKAVPGDEFYPPRRQVGPGISQ